MKKMITILLITMLAMIALTACGSDEPIVDVPVATPEVPAENLVEVPDVIGMFWVEARIIMSNLGFEFEEIDNLDDYGYDPIVVGLSIPPGTLIERGAWIAWSIGPPPTPEPAPEPTPEIEIDEPAEDIIVEGIDDEEFRKLIGSWQSYHPADWFKYEINEETITIIHHEAQLEDTYIITKVENNTIYVDDSFYGPEYDIVSFSFPEPDDQHFDSENTVWIVYMENPWTLHRVE